MTLANATVPASEALPAAAQRFVRTEHIPTGYSPWRHMALTLALAALLATLGAVLAARARPADWLGLPAFFVIANFIEWMVHRNPMHRPLRPRIMYRNHAQLHHLAFTDGNMVIGPTRDLGLIMMPWYTMLGLFVVASPVMVVAGMLRGPGLAGRLPARRRRLLPVLRAAARALPPARRHAGSRGHRQAARLPAAAGPPPPPSHPGPDGGGELQRHDPPDGPPVRHAGEVATSSRRRASSPLASCRPWSTQRR